MRATTRGFIAASLVGLSALLCCNLRKPLPRRPDAGPVVEMVEARPPIVGGPAASPAPAVQLGEEHEPNDDLEHAQLLAGQGIAGSLAAPTTLGAGKGDDDFFVFRSGRPNRFRELRPLKAAYRGTSSLVARALVLRHPWGVAVEVLKHEVAHQYVAGDLGDEHQMPPSFFFTSRPAEEDTGEPRVDTLVDAPAPAEAPSNLSADTIFDPPSEDPAIRDLLTSESLLTLARSRAPHVGLDWHYRCRSEELIAFSNHAFYAGSLLTIPAPPSLDTTALRWIAVTGGRLERGRNDVEARVVVDELTRLLQRAPRPSVATTRAAPPRSST